MMTICPHCHEEQLRTGLTIGEKVRCEACQEWFIVNAQAEEDLELEDPAVTGERLLNEVRKILRSIPQTEKYLIGDEIGSGGMGRVLEAYDPYIRRKIAIKILYDKQSDEEKARFLEEAQLTGQLEHPNIVPVHDLGFTADGKLFFLMKRVRGKSLDDVLEALRNGDPLVRNAFTMSRLLQILESVCSAVAYAHARGVIHRDLKPANIMLGDFGEVMVMDWGLAKAGSVRRRPTPQSFISLQETPRSSKVSSRYRESMRAATSAHQLPEVDLSHAVGIMRNDSNIWGTRKGTIAGTPAYMSPEQARGDLESLDERSDIYSLGGILYEILTGTPPVLGSTETEIVDRVIEHDIQTPRIRTPSRQIPSELSRIAMKGLAAAPAMRYQSVLDLQGDLRAFLDGITVYSRENNFWETVFRLLRHYKLASFLSGLFFALFVAGAVYLYQEQKSNMREAERDLHDARSKKENDKLRAPLEYNVANEYLAQNKIKAAYQHLELALSYDATFRLARMKKTELLLLEQKYREALSEAKILLKNNPADGDALRLSEQARKGINELEIINDDLPLPEVN